jgi:hypothetical protein
VIGVTFGRQKQLGNARRSDSGVRRDDIVGNCGVGWRPPGAPCWPGADRRLSAFGFRLSAFGFRLSAFGFRLSAFGLRLAACGLRRQRPLCANHYLSYRGRAGVANVSTMHVTALA